MALLAPSLIAMGPLKDHSGVGRGVGKRSAAHHSGVGDGVEVIGGGTGGPVGGERGREVADGGNGVGGVERGVRAEHAETSAANAHTQENLIMGCLSSRC